MNTTKNPFLDFDVTKFMDPAKFTDFTKSLADFKVPGVDMEALLVAQRRNVEALTAANQLAAEGFQAVLRRQAEIMRQSMEEASSVLRDVMTAGTPEDKVAKQTELVQAAFEKAVANMKEMAEMVAKANTEAADVISNRVKENLEEIRTNLSKAASKNR